MWAWLLALQTPVVVALQPYGSIPSGDIAIVRRAVESYYRVRVIVVPAMPLPGTAYYAPRDRYRAELLLKDLTSVLPVGANKVVGITKRDISTEAHGVKDWGVFGLGNLNGAACVVSTARLGRGRVSASEFGVRLSNVAAHEVGHTVGLPHCPTPGCLMADAAGSIRSITGKLSPLCGSCREKLGVSIVRSGP